MKMGKFRRKSKTLAEAKVELEKAKNSNSLSDYKVYKLKNAKVWKYVVATYLE